MPTPNQVAQNDPVVVVGGSLAGLAAATRLAKAGHRVVLLERETHLGGRWLPTPDQPHEKLAPILSLPAAWRDLFRKTGRDFYAELELAGLNLTPAPSTRHIFGDDGSELLLPTDRSGQQAALLATYGAPAAKAWRDLLDRLDTSWQGWRRAGLEEESPARLTTGLRADLLWDQTVEDLARKLPHPHLSELVRDTARRIGSDPKDTPAWAAARLAVERTFGRWQVVRGDQPVPASVLLQLLIDRLATRGVEVRTSTPAIALAPDLVSTPDGPIRAAAVVSTVDPWEHASLTGRPAPRTTFRRLTPALAPSVLTRKSPESSEPPISETVVHTHAGPIVTYRFGTGAGGTDIIHNHTAGRPEPGFGVAWRGWPTWEALQMTSGATGVFTAGVGARGGADPWAQLLTGALASYTVHERLTGNDIRPTYRPSTTVD